MLLLEVKLRKGNKLENSYRDGKDRKSMPNKSIDEKRSTQNHLHHSSLTDEALKMKYTSTNISSLCNPLTQIEGEMEGNFLNKIK